MNYLLVVISGVVQGITEFLPISSSGHLVVLHNFFQLDFIDSLSFDVVLHWGTMLALILFFWKDLLKYLKAFFQSLGNWQLNSNQDQRLAWYLIVGTIPAAVLGFFFEQAIETYLRNTLVVALMLIIFGIVLYLADRFSKLDKQLADIKLLNAVIIGIAQAVALVPGVSRSGITIIAGLTQKLNRQASARFSFLLSVPIVFGAGLKKLIDLFSSTVFVQAQIGLLLLGLIISAVTGIVCIKYFLQFLQRHSLRVFAYYRIFLGVALLVLLAVN